MPPFLRDGKTLKRKRDHSPWIEKMDDPDDAKTRETWAFQRLESFHSEVFPKGLPSEYGVDLNQVFCELDRSELSDPDTHRITEQWRSNKAEIRAFGLTVSKAKSWRDVVGDPAPLKIPAIGGQNEIMALCVLHHGFEISEWLSELWELMDLDWVIDPKSFKPEFWDGVKLSRGSDFQEQWPEGRPRRRQCDISRLLGLAATSVNGSTDVGKDAQAYQRHQRHQRRKVVGSNGQPTEPPIPDSDDEPLVDKRTHQPKAKPEDAPSRRARLHRALRENGALKRENGALKREIERLRMNGGRDRGDPEKIMVDIQAIEKRVEECREDVEGIREEVAGDLYRLRVDLHRSQGKYEAMDLRDENSKKRIDALEQRIVLLDAALRSSSRPETLYNTPTKTPSNNATTGTTPEGSVTSEPTSESQSDFEGEQGQENGVDWETRTIYASRT